jgi:hypothetical protein
MNARRLLIGERVPLRKREPRFEKLPSIGVTIREIDRRSSALTIGKLIERLRRAGIFGERSPHNVEAKPDDTANREAKHRNDKQRRSDFHRLRLYPSS